MGVLDLVGKAAKGAKKAAPFFSKADMVLDELPRGKGLGNEFLGELVKKGAKPTELRERGIEKALKDKPKMTKAEVQKIFEEKAPPKVQEKVLSSESPDYEDFLEAKAQEEYGVDWFDLSKQEKARLEKMYRELPTTQYEQYRTPGGENYREILLKLPKRGLTKTEQDELMLYEADLRRTGGQATPERMARYQELKAKEPDNAKNYTSGHYKEDPNLLAHIRVQDFTTPEGKKILLVDEIQSDWHQEGRKKGYKEEPKKSWLVKKPGDKVHGSYDSEEEAANAMQSLARAYGEEPRYLGLSIEEGVAPDYSGAVPDAPFKKNWHELAMKRVLDYAAENGYDSIAITPGAEQAKRYDLSKHLNEINYGKNQDGTFSLTAVDKRGKPALNESSLSESEIESMVGRDLAQRIFAGEGNDFPVGSISEGKKSLSGLDLVVGGEGKQVLYDTMLPKYLNTFGSPYGSSVGEIRLPVAPADSTKVQGYNLGDEYMQGRATWSEFLQANPDAAQNFSPAFHSFDITPQMREEVKTKGLPVYGKVAMPVLEGLAAGSGAATIGSQMFDENNEQQVQNPVHFTENPDAMLLELMQRN
jgi:hypothetical protein